MNLEQTTNPETLIVIRDGQLDLDYYESVYEAKRRAALKLAKTELIAGICSTPARVGRAVVYLFAHIAEQAN